MKPLSLVEARELTGIKGNKDMEGFIKKFAKMSKKNVIKLREELEKIDMLKLKSEHIAKIIDLLPEDSSDLNKILTDISLTENETNKILEIIKKYI